MSYLRDNLRPGEKVVLEARITPVPVWVVGFLCLPFVIGGLALAVRGTSGGLLTILLFGLPVLYVYLRYRRTELGITDRRVIEKTGIFSDNTVETTLDRIQNVTYKRSMLGKVLNYGTVIVQSAARFGVEGIKNVKDPKRVRDAILHQMEAYRGKQIQEQAEAIAKNLVQRQQR